MQVLRLESCYSASLYTRLLVLVELLYEQVLLVPIYLANQVDHWQQYDYVLALHLDGI